MAWQWRIWIFCREADSPTLGQIAADAAAVVFPGENTEAQRSSLIPVGPGVHGCSLGATEGLRAELGNRLAAAIAAGQVSGPVAIVRLDNGGRLVRASYAVAPDGPFGPGAGASWAWPAAVSAAATLMGG